MRFHAQRRLHQRAAFPPDNLGLDLFSAEEQATVRSFLSAVWMSGAKTLADNAAGHAAALDADIKAHIAMFERGRAVEWMRAGERALDERDRRARARTSPSRSTRDALAAVRVRVQMRVKTTWYRGDRCNRGYHECLIYCLFLHDHRYDLVDQDTLLAFPSILPFHSPFLHICRLTHCRLCALLVCRFLSDNF
ncbi:hypothetical protein DFH11DRAFT_1075133 [Phellopilus nigrolimitatus]|nr:hypothetical protein DFH11DRAFT_1075133 [Phellopilus nigrolimitatus]